MDKLILIEKIENLLSENNDQMTEAEIRKVLNITSWEIPWGYEVTWGREFQTNQTFDLVSRYYKNR